MREDKDAIFYAVETITKNGNVIRPDWNGFNVLLLSAAQAAALDLGLVPESSNSIESGKFLYLVGADDPDDKGLVQLDRNHHAQAVKAYQQRHSTNYKDLARAVEKKAEETLDSREGVELQEKNLDRPQGGRESLPHHSGSHKPKWEGEISSLFCRETMRREKRNEC
ncbi:hypothetical protein GOBAR_AA20108 [Gossypium barbadense]|uniref:Molybdopterin oxidoreductase domain-containing protein n=1 Tax=Gossypium barbadense TaxID=3634 RepID=A0A2P5XB34_GOSBA|nr:hypothetical protein GOBAR_AA20108 [Gossypium barbadense]